MRCVSLKNTHLTEEKTHSPVRRLAHMHLKRHARLYDWCCCKSTVLQFGADDSHCRRRVSESELQLALTLQRVKKTDRHGRELSPLCRVALAYNSLVRVCHVEQTKTHCTQRDAGLSGRRGDCFCSLWRVSLNSYRSSTRTLPNSLDFRHMTEIAILCLILQDAHSLDEVKCDVNS